MLCHRTTNGLHSQAYPGLHSRQSRLFTADPRHPRSPLQKATCTVRTWNNRRLWGEIEVEWSPPTEKSFRFVSFRFARASEAQLRGRARGMIPPLPERNQGQTFLSTGVLRLPAGVPVGCLRGTPTSLAPEEWSKRYSNLLASLGDACACLPSQSMMRESANAATDRDGQSSPKHIDCQQQF